MTATTAVVIVHCLSVVLSLASIAYTVHAVLEFKRARRQWEGVRDDVTKPWYRKGSEP